MKLEKLDLEIIIRALELRVKYLKSINVIIEPTLFRLLAELKNQLHDLEMID